MSVLIDLDAKARKRPPSPWPATAVALIVSAAVALAVLVVLVVRPATPPALRLTAQWLPRSERVPTALVWYVDGAQEDVTARLGAEAWRPERPVRLVTVVAEVACQIWVADTLAAEARSQDGRYAVCAWSPN